MMTLIQRSFNISFMNTSFRDGIRRECAIRFSQRSCKEQYKMAAVNNLRLFVELFRLFVEERGAVAMEHKLLRDAHNPFHINEDAFVSLFRLRQDMVLSIAESVRHQFHGHRASYIPVERQILITLMVFGQGSYQRPAGRDWGLAVSQPTVSRCVRRVTTAINIVMLERWIKMPISPQERQRAKGQFEDAPQPFPGAIGAIDCTHVAIIRPTVHEEAYKNHHDFHSLNVQLICDPDLIILDVNARFPGARHDYYIWRASMVRTLMSTLYQRGERHTWLLGDAGYALEPWLMTPLPHAAPNTPAFHYTMAHCKARNVVERCFGVLKSTWRILSSQRVVMYDPAYAGLIVNACCVLHNMRRTANLGDELENPLQGMEENRNEAELGFHDEDEDGVRVNRGQQLALARRIQHRLIHQHFAR